ncbi:glycosyltransferase family 2 protein [Cognatiluteimonas weifangensis]|uniref:Glycosyltransferase family 2 protein n=1 Tax=Cognatiluteimonas weifangensis TaxID=2303539 RepID=A0A372DHD7_9GAMM|nr:glycosyltransferase family 2 protein [Luteimonas weifangensis]RFP58946.1 glycosyltransferase family 2 protein [Luteimonas weifangensis]
MPDPAPPLGRHDLAVVIPALNEALRIRGVVEGALAQCPRVIVIDDGSDDDTVAQLAGLPLTLLRHPRRMGKGACLRDGFREALRQGAAAVLTMDGDGQHAAEDIPRLLAAANRHPGRVVIGARLRRRSQQPLPRRLANEFGDWGLAWGTGYQIADSQSGQRLYPAAVAALEDVPGEDFVFEAQILISASRRLGTRCVSVPIESRYKSVHSGEQFRASHFRPLRDLWRITSHIVLQALRYGQVPAVYRSIRAHPPLIDDPDGEFAAPLQAAPAPPA